MEKETKISELIQELQECLNEYGDIPVKVDVQWERDHGRGTFGGIDLIESPERFLVIETYVNEIMN